MTILCQCLWAKNVPLSCVMCLKKCPKISHKTRGTLLLELAQTTSKSGSRWWVRRKYSKEAIKVELVNYHKVTSAFHEISWLIWVSLIFHGIFLKCTRGRRNELELISGVPGLHKCSLVHQRVTLITLTKTFRLWFTFWPFSTFLHILDAILGIPQWAVSCRMVREAYV